MFNINKIIKLILITAFVCVISTGESWAGGASGSWEVSDAAGVNKAKDCNPACKEDEVCLGIVATKTVQCVKKTSAGSNTQASKVTITGCSGNFGLFSGLITAGQDIFKGLRDLIYVVAGFGIIGVAVGGFFGNLNWKWLGAIVIALIVIATTGELLAAITNCQSFTSTYIQDTLK